MVENTNEEVKVETTSTVAPTMSIQELATIANIIDVAVQRGAFKTTEVRQVGEVYEKLTAFVKYVVDSQSKGSEA